MKDTGKSKKRDLISQNNSRILVIIGIAGAIFGFSLVASYTLVKQMTYKSKVIGASVKADEQLKDNVESVSTLVAAYESFNSASESVIGTADENARIVLDALPSKYDFPALATSLDKIMSLSGLTDITIGGTDAEADAEQSSASPEPIEIPVTLTGKGNYQNAQLLVTNLEKSIRPIKISSITFSGKDSELSVSVTGVTYYQPKKTLEIEKKEVK